MRAEHAIRCVAALLWFVGMVTSSTTSNAAEYVPDVLTLDGREGIAFTSGPALDLNAQGTIEFWVAAEWQRRLSYSPTVLSNIGAEGAAYTIAINGDRQAISLQSGDQIAESAFDFSDGLPHHVAFVNFGDEVLVLIDGRLTNSLQMQLADLPADVLWIGANTGNSAVFEGAIAGLRIWDSALLPTVLADFALRPLIAETQMHPNIEALVGSSDFGNSDFYITDTILVSPPDALDASARAGDTTEDGAQP